MIEAPQVVKTAAQDTAVLTLTIRMDEMQQEIGPGYRELMDTVAAQGVGTAGAWFIYFRRMDPDAADFDIGVPVTKPVSPAGRVKPGRLPAATVARAVYRGSYEGLPAAWAELDAWTAQQGRTAAEGGWEVYTAGPESSPDPANWRSELNRLLVGA